MVTNRLTGKPQWSPMGSSANMEGRTLAQVLAGKEKTYPGVLGTGVVKLPGLNIGRTGLTEEQARAAGYDVITVVAPTDDKAHYYPVALKILKMQILLMHRRFLQQSIRLFRWFIFCLTRSTELWSA